MGRNIEENVERRLYAESMGMCMNPKCRCELFREGGDIIEKAHIVPYCKTADNSFENLVVLCPNCHTDFDKNHAFTGEEVLSWKKIRREELERFFGKKFATFDELKNEVVPLLLENKGIYENYYLTDNRELWDLFEYKILANNKKLELLFSKNLSLIQHYEMADWNSNLVIVNKFLNHVKEFEATRDTKEKVREVLFPTEINSIFGIEPIKGSMILFAQSLELLIQQLKAQNKFEKIVLGVESPYLVIKENGKLVKIFLDDTPQIRQLYYNYHCFKETGVRLKSLNFALRRINFKKLQYKF